MSVFVLGGAQTDFARHFGREGKTIADLLGAGVLAALERAEVAPEAVEVAHVGNFVAELFCKQGHLGGIFASIDPAFDGLPTSRHEAACASGSVAVLSAMADIESGRYDVACVAGVEQMRNVPGDVAAAYLGAAAWAGREAEDARYLWPEMFSRVADVYEERWGLRREHLSRIAKKNFDNAKKNPRAQTRGWSHTEASFGEGDDNPVVEGRIRRQDCAQITDGAACVVLASERFAREHAKKVGRPLERFARILGFGHRTATMLLEDKIARSRAGGLLFPHVRGCLEDAWRRAGLASVRDVDALEVHDCFTITEYMICDHLGLHAPGEVHRAIDEGVFEKTGALPVNPSGGLIGGGHPVGATGVRMLVDAERQVTGRAGDTQIDGARRVQTLNLGGSATTVVSFVVGI